MIQSIQLTQMSFEDLGVLIKEAVSSEFKKLSGTLIVNQRKDSTELLTREQASKMLSVSLTTLFHWNNDKTLPARKIGRKVFYLKQDVLDKLNGAA